jgi:RNA polymerase sigma-70 factor (ECF subfamily)
MPSLDESRAAANRGDLEFVARLLRREPAAIEEMGRRLSCLMAMLRYQAQRLGAPLSEHELEEVAQDTVVALWGKLASYKGRASLETWAFRFATLELLKSIQRHARGPAALLPLDGDAHPAAETEPDAKPPVETAELLAGLEHLEPATARVIRRRHQDDASFDDIAAAEGLPLNTVKARYYRGLKRLREHLERRVRREEKP